MNLPHWTTDKAAAVQAVAAVIQTLAAVVALFVAVGVPLWQRGSERKLQRDDRRARTSALVFILMPDVVLPFGWRIAPARNGTAIWNEKLKA